MNTVGTYGIGSAAYWWARVGAAILVRLPHYIAGPSCATEQLLYVDDHLQLASTPEGVEFMGAFLFLLVALGVPLRWDKCRGGTRVDWIGFVADLDRTLIGISESRAAWLSGWMRAKVSEGIVRVSDFAAVLGRLSFAMSALEFIRPFLAPLFTWAAAVRDHEKMRLPWSILFLLEFLAGELESGGRLEKVRHVEQDHGIAFRADAKAEGQLIRIGGWECIGGRRPHEARWFAVELTRQTAPWAYAKGDPFRTTAALELYGSLLCVMLFGDQWVPGAGGTMQLEGLTDNLGNSFVLSRLMSSKFPLVAILAEMAVQLRERAMGLELNWIPREQNEEADALTNGNFAAFSPQHRIEVEISDLPWKILPKMLAAAEEIFTRTQSASRAKVMAGTGSRLAQNGKRRPLRVTDPW